MKGNEREIILLYNPSSGDHRKVVVHAKAVVSHLKTYSYEEFHRLTTAASTWRKILQSLDVDPKLLLNKAHPYYQQNIRGKDFDEAGWIQIFKHNPDMIKAPIGMRNGKAVVCKMPTDIYRLTNERPQGHQNNAMEKYDQI